MACLHFANLELKPTDVALKQVFYGLKDIAEYLRRSQEYLEKHAVLRVICRLLSKEELKELTAEERAAGVWVEIDEPEGGRGENDRVLRAFLDESTRSVYELAWRPARGDKPAQYDFSKEHRIDVQEREPLRQRLCLERKPEASELLLRPETYVLQKQLEAVQALQNAPHPAHRPLLELFQGHRYARWKRPESIAVEDWFLLRSRQAWEPLRPGTQEQRDFVLKAMATPEWALLEGPPGSGKTTAICEFILQELHRGHRVLLCASTHVAVDNVLERLMDPEQPHHQKVLPVRIGDRKKISEAAQPWQLETLRRTERERLLAWLRAQAPRSLSQETLLEALQRPGNDVIDRIILDSANVVCGTTIGILQHPDIQQESKKEWLGRRPLFDVLIIDEASKTTFQEFLVPALLASRWILVGDPRQLSPYVEEEHLAANLSAALPHEALRAATLDTFEVEQGLRAPLLPGPGAGVAEDAA